MYSHDIISLSAPAPTNPSPSRANRTIFQSASNSTLTNLSSQPLFPESSPLTTSTSNTPIINKPISFFQPILSTSALLTAAGRIPDQIPLSDELSSTTLPYLSTTLTDFTNKFNRIDRALQSHRIIKEAILSIYLELDQGETMVKAAMMENALREKLEGVEELGMGAKEIAKMETDSDDGEQSDY